MLLTPLNSDHTARGEAIDVAVIGAGAAGIFAALAARGVLDARGALRPPAADAPRVLLLDTKRTVGRKIRISGGGRCNATNEAVVDRDFDTDAPAVVRGVLAGFPVAAVRAFFRDRGVGLAEEPIGKLFPREGGAAAVLDALLRAVEEAGIATEFGANACLPCRNVEAPPVLVGYARAVAGRPCRRVVDRPRPTCRGDSAPRLNCGFGRFACLGTSATVTCGRTCVRIRSVG